ncbi:hypothetical protein FLACOL7796_04566 [Flavobacterium collinsii]|uniref:TRAP C4-dicarboxylate transport system permease DctM subunit domain-containing protein n=1 Tax=Flavobacterium collinsii TaxID=1114861 RepID=A0ABM8KPT4_9FLAO|nr:hypothetical protein FLACOL7796_04566 [Flavobacterium collinsii]
MITSPVIPSASALYFLIILRLKIPVATALTSSISAAISCTLGKHYHLPKYYHY